MREERERQERAESFRGAVPDCSAMAAPGAAMVDLNASVESGQSGGVLNAKLARRKLQHDVELLSNRVERLREEERKAKQKVLETRLRGQEISALQKRNEQAATAKALAKRMEEDQLVRERQESRLKRVQEKKALKEVYAQMYSARREDVRAERIVKAENAELVRAVKQFDVARAQKMSKDIRVHHKVVTERFEKQRQAHQEFLAQDFINMIAMEDKRREQVEKEIMQMEEEERRHIENLRKLQEEQKSAYDSLEQALATR